MESIDKITKEDLYKTYKTFYQLSNMYLILTGNIVPEEIVTIVKNNNDELKAKHYELIQKLAEDFKKEHSTIICRELLDLNEKISSPIPSKRTQEYYQERPCAKFIETACKLISEID